MDGGKVFCDLNQSYVETKYIEGIPLCVASIIESLLECWKVSKMIN